MKFYHFFAVMFWLLLPGWAIAQSQPNLILIIADDLGPQLGCYGDPNALTPHLDQLAASGARFTDAHVTAASCSPSRGSMFTGLYPHQHGMYGLSQGGWSRMHDDVPKLPNTLKALGYRTGIIGKTHFQPFHLFTWDYVETNGQKVVHDRDVRWMNKKGIDFIEDDADGKPVFLVMSYVDPHRGGPSYGPGKNQEFPRIKMDLPENPLPPEQTHPIPFLAVDTPTVRSENSDYYAAVERLDVGVSEFLEAMDKRLDPENTLVLFIGDHGPDVTRGKISAYHSATHIPFLMRWTGVIEPGLVMDELVSTVDIFPTFVDAAGGSTDMLDERQTGLDLLTLFTGEAQPWRDHLFTEFITHVPWHYFPRYTVMDGRYHYVYNLHGDGGENPLVARNYCEAWLAATAEGFEDQTVAEAYGRVGRPPRHELFDLREDPYSIHNLADDPAYASTLRQLNAELQAWREETRDPFLSEAFQKSFARQTAQMKADYEARTRGH